jgi:hypothetical protein
MTFDIDDPVLKRVHRLAVLDADGNRREEVRLRCRRTLGENRRRSERRASARPAPGRALDYGLTYGLCAAYFLGLVVDVLRLYLRQ